MLRQVAEGNTQAVIEEDGTPVATLVSIDDLRRIQRDEDFRALETYAKGFEEVPIAELEQEVANTLRQARSKRRKQCEQTTSNT